MDEKKVVEILSKELKKLERSALTSTDPCVVAQHIAFSDKRVSDLLTQKLKDGYRFRSIQCLSGGYSIPEYRRVFVELDCGEDTFCLVTPSFLAIVNMEAKSLVGDPIDHYSLKPGEFFYQGYGDTYTYQQQQQLQQQLMWQQQLPMWQQHQLHQQMPMQMNLPQQMPINFQQQFPTTATYSRALMEAPIGFNRMPEPRFRETTMSTDRIWTPEARILPLTPGTVRLTAAVAVPNSCYIEGRAQIGVPQDHQILPEQIGIILPIDYTDQPYCMQYIKHLAYDVTFDINEAKTGVVLFSVLGNRVVGYAYCDLPQFIRMQNQQRQQLLTR
jgi:hypothetical protein